MKKANPEMQRLLWILDFIKLDVDRLTKADFVKLLIETGEMIKNLGFLRPRERKDMPEELVEDGVPYVEDSPKWRERVRQIQGRIRIFFDKIFEMKNNYETTKDRNPILSHILQIKSRFFVAVGHGEIYLGHIAGKYDLEYEIAELIRDCSPKVGYYSGHSLENLKKCQAPECKKYFWQVHKKEKNYCSNKCAWRAYSAFRREEERKDKAKQKGGK